MLIHPDDRGDGLDGCRGAFVAAVFCVVVALAVLLFLTGR